MRNEKYYLKIAVYFIIALAAVYLLAGCTKPDTVANCRRHVHALEDSISVLRDSINEAEKFD